MCLKMTLEYLKICKNVQSKNRKNTCKTNTKIKIAVWKLLPIKQGLKLSFKARCPSGTNVWKLLPIKQGLKP